MSGVTRIPLRGGTTIPQIGFGVYKIPPAETEQAVAAALEAGYRHVDTAALYGNEAEVGRAIRASGVPRDDVFVTTKVWNDRQGYDETLRAFDESLDRLGMDVVDLYLIHWPAPARDRYVDTWRALIHLQEEGRVREIGVSNFTAAHLRRLVDETGVVPAINQVELNPWFAQWELVEEHARLGIVTEAWAPLDRGRRFDDPVLTEIADRLGVTPGQVVLRWHVERGIVAIPKSVTPSRIRENLDVFGFTLDEDDMAALAQLDTGVRSGGDPGEVS
jgi:2,5-diketo-D-gluconate reductase A